MGFGIGALASQLGAITVSAVSDADSAEVGGIQNTVTNFGAALGTALVGAVLISSLTTGLLHGVETNTAIPASVKTTATVQMAGGVPFVSDTDLRRDLADASVPQARRTPSSQENSTARLAALRDALWVVALVAAGALFFTGLIPKIPIGRPEGGGPPNESTRPMGTAGRGATCRPGACTTPRDRPPVAPLLSVSRGQLEPAAERGGHSV